VIDLKQYGYLETEPLPDDLLPARIIAVHMGRFELIGKGGTLFGRLKASLYYHGSDEAFPTVGDFVLYREVSGGDGLIIRTLPRKSCFIRRDPGVKAFDQAVAANIDTVFIMTSLNQDFNVNRIERYVIMTWQSGANPVVLLTKSDLVEGYTEQINTVQDMVPGVDVIPVSVISKKGLDRLGAYLTTGQTVVFLGMSGVGKSSLLNALMEREVMAVKAIRENDSRGRHTTTHRQLFTLPTGAMVIDTPGMRMMGFWDSGEKLGGPFSQIETLLGICRFSDCSHSNEPGCAILAALARGELPKDLWEKYGKLQREARHSDNRAAYLQRKQARQHEREQYSKRKSGDAYETTIVGGCLTSKLPVKRKDSRNRPVYIKNQTDRTK